MLQYIILCGLQAQGRAKGDITKSPRSMAKLLKEAKRVKMVLSANTDHVELYTVTLSYNTLYVNLHTARHVKIYV